MFTDQKNVIKMTKMPKAIYRFNAIANKMSMSFYKEIEKTILKPYGTKKEHK